MITFRTPKPQDTETIVALNEAVVAVTSPMDSARFLHLLDLSDFCIVAEDAGAVIGFVIAMQDGAPYDNANFAWFSERLNKFVYIDRIVIGAGGRGKGLGKQLYDQVSAAAKAQGRLVMAAEMDLVPPNEGSLGFHKKSGFVALGERTYDTGKVVSMQIKNL
ncbi:GNAT family N-acetyltransferase [uncultured Tateyamaria sp.]|uniref:GNAT family N-acetyltransferase n=1 Tax=uncultured Tateyamaria sp. TaxID=455651 RepID=UPI002621E82B|nr:GNAT family N-acetyltransferase [uncultured Tateyamaria sp.]